MCLFLFCLTAFATAGDVQLKAGFDKDGLFNNRLRFTGELFGFSLLASLSQDEIKYIEPDFISPTASVGRVFLKGFIRELYNPDGLNPAASVLTETTAVSVTDSMSRSSRYGLVISPGSSIDFNTWLFRANSGLFSGGLMLNDLKLDSFPEVCPELDIVLNIVSYGGKTGSEWFDSSPAVPSQYGINPAAEIRLAGGTGDDSGRRMMKPLSDDLTAAFSLLAAASLPQYTAQGYLLRSFAAVGTKKAAFHGLFQMASPEYIRPSGKVLTFGLITGAGFSAVIKADIFSISFNTDYCLKRKNPELLPSRFIEQTQGLDSDVKIFWKIFSLALVSSYNTSCEHTGVNSDKASIEAQFGIDSEYVRIKLNCGSIFDEPGSYSMSRSFCCSASLALILESLRFSLGSDYSDDEITLKTGLKINTENYVISGSVDLKSGLVEGFSIGFETSKK